MRNSVAKCAISLLHPRGPNGPWIGRDSRRVRGALSYYAVAQPGKSYKLYEADSVRRIAGKTFVSQMEYSNWVHSEATVDQLIQIHLVWLELNPTSWPSKIRLNELVLFNDYREVAPGVWLPFHEVRAVPYASETDKSKRMVRRSELRVEEVKTDLSHADRFPPAFAQGRRSGAGSAVHRPG